MKPIDKVQEFFREVIGLNFEWVYISVESSLHDFEDIRDVKRIVKLIKSKYGVNVSRVKDLNLCKIFEKLEFDTKKSII